VLDNITPMDLVFIGLLGLLVPFLVEIYLKPPYVVPSAKRWVIVGGLLWLLYAVVAEPFSRLLGAPWMDALAHAVSGQRLVVGMETHGWSALRDHYATGNRAYQCACALVMWTGASFISMAAISGFLAFWGGLILVRSFCTVGPFPANKPLYLALTIFCPSVVYWGTMPLKESPMFWTSCVILSACFREPGQPFIRKLPLVLVALFVGSILRPVVTTGWALAACAAGVLNSGHRMAAIATIACLPMLFAAFQSQIKYRLQLESAMEVAEQQSANLGAIREQGSLIEGEGGKPIFFVSGFISAFVRPFPWDVNSVRVLLGAVEVWGMTLLILLAWGRSTWRIALQTVRIPAFGVAVLAAGWMCALLSYYPNQGLVLRQRVQMIPALLALVMLPLLVKQSHLLKYTLSRLLARRAEAESASQDARSAELGHI
jgi:hypothetical protein